MPQMSAVGGDPGLACQRQGGFAEDLSSHGPVRYLIAEWLVSLGLGSEETRV